MLDIVTNIFKVVKFAFVLMRAILKCRFQLNQV